MKSFGLLYGNSISIVSLSQLCNLCTEGTFEATRWTWRKRYIIFSMVRSN
jgi:hypothetical protein